ncbi:MAG: FadR/GntR family transcriptional regulator [Actinomycetota bacterium]
MASSPLAVGDDPRYLVFRPIRSGNTFEECVERLLQSVRLGIVRPGERLPPERELATMLGVSRVTLREAIRSLQQNGYVESRRGRHGGTFVLPRPVRDEDRPDPRRMAAAMGPALEDALVLRRVLEVGAAEAAAGAAVPAAARRQLADLLEEARTVDVSAYRQVDSRLHLAIAELAGSPSLTAAMAEVRMRLNDLLDAIPLLPRNIVHSNEQHEQVVRAILAGRGEQARAAMAEHVDGTAALLRGFLG